VDLTSTLTAVAATVAALLSGVAIYIAGPRESHAWLRVELQKEYATYLQSSFDISAAAKAALKARETHEARGRGRLFRRHVWGRRRRASGLAGEREALNISHAHNWLA
jgi:hypothetical protein